MIAERHEIRAFRTNLADLISPTIRNRIEVKLDGPHRQVVSGLIEDRLIAGTPRRDYTWDHIADLDWHPPAISAD